MILIPILNSSLLCKGYLKSTIKVKLNLLIEDALCSFVEEHFNQKNILSDWLYVLKQTK